ncbi:MAG: GNAT family N-acetyltransferase [Thermotogota bacterium]|nr:GNAT family N-acetyltransferase [Thermotogota bacterium]
MAFMYKKNVIPDSGSVMHLYDDAGFTSYTKDLDCLMKALENSLFIITAWENDSLIGLVRAVGDGKTILYIQDILVLSSYRRKGIGTSLLKQLINEFPDVRQKVLLTDDKPENRKFYESLGFISCDNGKLIAFARFDN